jgi:type IV secretory pathway protease TraF
MRRIASLVAMIALAIGIAAAVASPAEAAPVHGCPDADICVYKNNNFGTPIAPRTAGSIVFAPGHCWVFNADWVNQTSSYVLNFGGSPGQAVRFYDGNSCTGTYFTEPNPPGAFANMPSGWNDRVNSIWTA